MDINIKYLCCREVAAVEYFEWLGMRYGGTNAVTQSVWICELVQF